jgi:hypothetical protein
VLLLPELVGEESRRGEEVGEADLKLIKSVQSKLKCVLFWRTLVGIIGPLI